MEPSLWSREMLISGATSVFLFRWAPLKFKVLGGAGVKKGKQLIGCPAPGFPELHRGYSRMEYGSGALGVLDQDWEALWDPHFLPSFTMNKPKSLLLSSLT